HVLLRLIGKQDNPNSTYQVPGLNFVVTALQFISEPTPGLLVLVEERKAGQPSSTQLLYFPSIDRKWMAPGMVSEFTSAPGQAAFHACSGNGVTAVALAATSVFEHGHALVQNTTLRFLRWSAPGRWEATSDLLRAEGAPAFDPNRLVADSGSVLVQCEAQDYFSVFLRSSGELLRYRFRPDGRAQSAAHFFLSSQGYGFTGSGFASCGETLVWIDNRMERGGRVFPWNLANGVPWSDDYSGWGINTVFASAFTNLRPNGQVKPSHRLSSDLGRQSAVAAVRIDTECFAVWSGQEKVSKAGPSAKESSQRLVFARLPRPNH
ncbi:MAG: hypothetical protein QM757_46965, partial [Paludibaculum sp.]